MAKDRICVRFKEEEIAGIEAYAKALAVTQTQVVRMAVQGLFNNTSTSQKLAARLDDLRMELQADIGEHFDRIWSIQRETTWLLVQALDPSVEAIAAFKKVYGGSNAK